ncbi:hypothetical protein [Bradyrhizobium sp. BR 10289]|uniref:hypothetical protein n=1 Tax=Bradyrhizobium sp. BR 10289 TaxID=2749993 RepID=UPI001C65223B|nr:hypothetical protein [Bradyrhizobium sp. BR 10289]MBW7972277.1 hypothetical protein [Bradyrhizobium sp. BR 10289]
MLGTDQADETAGSMGTALVPMVPMLQWVNKGPLPRPNSSFVTQLIANAEHVPQTTRLRRASSADALLAYGSRRPLGSVSARTRQVA